MVCDIKYYIIILHYITLYYIQWAQKAGYHSKYIQLKNIYENKNPRT